MESRSQTMPERGNPIKYNVGTWQPDLKLCHNVENDPVSCEKLIPIHTPQSQS